MEFKRISLCSNSITRGTRSVFKKPKITYFYWIFALLRILLCFVTQTGYIHPDEFFQSIEVISGYHFDIDTYKPWEFNNTFPIRTIVYPYLSVAIPYSFLNFCSQYANYYLGINLKTVYFLILFPRLFMCLCSFIADYCLYKICTINNLCYNEYLVIFSSSFIMLTYATRTFSNSIELILLALLLYYVSRCMDFSNKVVYQGNRLKKKYDEAQTIVDRVKVHKLLSALPPHSLKDCLIIASICVTGLFNRPTFVAFAICPVFFWLQRGLGSKVVGLVDFHIRIITFVFCTVPALVSFILIDSFYFGYLTIGEVARLELSINNFVFTPLNFVKYNLFVDNLKNHGLHPRYLHFLVNVPLLFNIFGIIGLLLIVELTYRIIQKQWLQLPRIQSIEGLMIASFMVPIAILSLIPHQEARFLIPVLFPLSFCTTPMSRQFHSKKTIVQCFGTVVSKKIIYTKNNDDVKCNYSHIKLLWYICNFILLLFYGFMHQGSVLHLTSHIATELKAKPELTHVYLFTSYMYPIPTALLHLRNTKKIYKSSDNHKYQLVQDFYLFERGSESMQFVLNAISEKTIECEMNYQNKKLPYRMYYSIPGSAFKEFVTLMEKHYAQQFQFTIVKTFYPHITTEMLPRIEFLDCVLFYNNTSNCVDAFFVQPVDYMINFFSQFNLLLIKIVPIEIKTV